MEKGFFSTMFLFLVLCSLVVSGITYYKVQRCMREGWSTQSNGGLYDTNYIGGLGWGKGYGDWGGVETDSGLGGNGNVQGSSLGGGNTVVLGNTTVSGNWTAPGWSVLFKGEDVGGVDIDQVFHKTSLEGELGENLDSPPAEETINRLGGGWSRSSKPLWKNNGNTETGGNSIIPPSGPPDDSYGKINGDLTFYAPGSFMYGADNYVPSYATSVLLSPMLGVNAPLRPVHGEGQGGGSGKGAMEISVCSPDSGASILDMEAYCQQLNASDAANKKCCISLGGKHSMAGNEQGPYNRSIYTNPIVAGSTNYYLHLGKCYGDCPSSQQIVTGASV
jgi:hypothetical protein